jgi:carboxylate-amine ligase
LDAEIVVDNTGRVLPLTTAITDLVEDLLPIARRLDCAEELEAIPRLMGRGASYQRQRAAAGANNGDLTAVVDLLLAEMRDGLTL